MIRNSILFFALFLVTSVASAQNWIDQGPFPDSKTFWRGSSHGVAVDAEDKIWLSEYFPGLCPNAMLGCPNTIDQYWVVGEDTVKSQVNDRYLGTGSIHVYNSDGTKADIGPFHSLTFEGTTDTLDYRGHNTGGVPKRITGIKSDHNGDIIVMVGEGVSLMFKLNHKTGEVINRLDFGTISGFKGSPASPGIDANGNIYVAPVNSDAPIGIFDSDFVWQGNVSLKSPGNGRAIEVSADGNTVYWSVYTEKGGAYKYQRPKEFSQYDSLGLILPGLRTESSDRHPTTGHIWLSNAVATGNAPNTRTAWALYGIDPATDQIVDSLHLDLPEFLQHNNNQVRGLAFSPSGLNIFAGLFNPGYDGTSFFHGEGDVQRAFTHKKFMRGQVTSIQRDPVEIPDGFTLSQNYPNPFNPQTRIEFEIRDAGLASLKVYDLLGREVATLVDEHLVAGKYTATFNASNLPSGSYVYQLDVAGNRLSGKMTLVK